MEKTSLACFRHLLIKGHFWVKVNTQITNWRLKLDRRASQRPFQSTWLKQQEVWIWGCKKQWLLTWMGLNEDHYSKASHELSECRIQLKQSEKSATQRWRVSTNVKLSVISIFMEEHSVILVWLIRIYDIWDWWYEKDKKWWTENRALRHACEYGGGRWGRRINFHKGWAVGQIWMNPRDNLTR